MGADLTTDTVPRPSTLPLTGPSLDIPTHTKPTIAILAGVARTARALQLALTAPDGIGPMARRYLLLEDLTWTDPELVRAQRAGWPTWRRAVRPVGALAWITGIVWSYFVQSPWSTANTLERILTIALVSIVVSCVSYGIVDGIIWRSRHRANTPPLSS